MPQIRSNIQHKKEYFISRFKFDFNRSPLFVDKILPTSAYHFEKVFHLFLFPNVLQKEKI